MIGQRIGSYTVLSKLGEGGMGEVYRARDAKLDRDVALKVLPDQFASHPERLARFDREARTLAALNHPGIAHIHGFEDSGGVRALVMELVEGPTLADQIARGPIPLGDALPIARQIADALSAAHDQGIVHRDLKPANIKVRDDGTVKVLDFGLAKALDQGPVASDQGPANTLAQSPTITSPAMTMAGMILGTAAYMAPEQAKGRIVDKRADVWAFGCVLFEMLAGRRPFDGDDVSETLAYVITREPDWSALPKATPPSLVRLIRRCLVKAPKHRLRDIGDARFDLDEAPAAYTEPGAVAIAPPARRGWKDAAILAGVAIGAALATAASTRWTSGGAETARPTQRLTVEAPGSFGGGAGSIGIAASPDGRYLAYVGISGPVTQLYLRRLDELNARPLAGTEGAINPFFSPDGTWIGFFVNNPSSLRKVPTAGGPVVTVSTAALFGLTGTWLTDDTIVFGADDNGALGRVSSSGGAVKPVSTPSAERGETWHAHPHALPGDQHLLISITAGVAGAEQFVRSRIAVLTLATGETRTIIERGYRARYVTSGHIVYVGDGNLMAVPFDATRLEVTGAPVPIVERLATETRFGGARYTTSPAGFLVYQTDLLDNDNTRRSLVWVGRDGNEQAVPAPLREYVYPRLSPDGTRVALGARDEETDLWIWDLARGGLGRFTFGPVAQSYPVWTPDGRGIVFDDAQSGILWQAADGTGAPEPLMDASRSRNPYSVSPDGRHIVVRQTAEKTGQDLGVVDVESRALRPLVTDTGNQVNGEISPDGRWLAYQSNESGQEHVYVRPFPDTSGGKWQVSTDGGTRPLWSRNGRELFFAQSEGGTVRIWSVPVRLGTSFAYEAPQRLFEGPFSWNETFVGRQYDVTADGQKFLLIKGQGLEQRGAPFTIVLNWHEELKQRVPSR